MIIYLSFLLMGGLICIGHFVGTLAWRRRSPVPIEPWPGSWSDFLYFLCWVVFGLFIGSFAVTAWYDYTYGTSDDESVLRVLFSGLGMQAGMLAVLLGFPLLNPSQWGSAQAHALPWPRAMSQAGYGFLAALPLITLLQFLLVTGLAHWGIEAPLQPVVEILRESSSLLEWTLVAGMTVILAPLSEELLFRGWLYRFLKGQLRPWLAAQVSALLFALVHLNAFAFFPLWLLGLLLIYGYEYSGSLRVPILWHALFNLNTLIFLAIQ